MDLITALAVSIGLLGGVATYLFLSPFGYGLQIWAAFIAWASFYHAGGGTSGFTSSVLANLWGVLWGAITLIAITQTGYGSTLGLPLWAGICVAVGVALMILGAKISPFSAIPAQVYGFAATVAFTLLTNTAFALMRPDLSNPAIVIALSMVVGAVFGLVSQKLVGALTRS
ncbi:MAG TPA: DUF1097 domain-containing protein [Hyphomicrobium sp.]|nr:DUF1097 domain-containing protein [Hyphomicrobium sp.]